jgi:hypothetical protein
LPIQSVTPPPPTTPAQIADQIDLGALTRQISPHLVAEVITTAGRPEQRRRKLPAAAVLYFVLALCLFSSTDSTRPPGYRSVWRTLTRHLRPHTDPADPNRSEDDHPATPPPDRTPPTSPALTRARQRLGHAPLELLFDRLRGPRATPDTPGAFALGRRLVAWDGTILDIDATDATLARFGHPARGSDPQIRLLTLIECGTHAILDAAFDSAGGPTTASELALARRVLHALTPGMLLVADRNFPGYHLWDQATGTGADLVWRIKKNLVLPPVQTLDDGSYLAIMRTPAGNRRHGAARRAGRVPRPEHGHLVRVVDYTVTLHGARGGPRTEVFRLVTTLLDPQHAPAEALAGLYHQRWESETGYGELKTRLRGAGFMLRSRTPELVEQELFAFLIVYQVLSEVRAQAAGTAGLDPDRISFTVALRSARDVIGLAITPGQALRDLIADLLGDLLPPQRRSRQYDRRRKPPKNAYRNKKPDRVRPPSRITHTITVTRRHPQPAPPP